MVVASWTITKFCTTVNELWILICNWHRKYILIIKPNRCSNFLNLHLELNSTCFRQFLCPSSGVFHCTHSSGICHTGFLTARKLSANLHVLLCVQWKTPDDGQRNCLKHVEFNSKNELEKLVLLVGFIIRIYHYAWSPEHQTKSKRSMCKIVFWKFSHQMRMCLYDAQHPMRWVPRFFPGVKTAGA